MKLVNRYLLMLAGMTLLLVVFHLFWSDVRIGGVKWFHLDRERNLPTWFSGCLFFSLGLSAIHAWIMERGIGREYDDAEYRLSFGWLLFGLFCFWISLDEMTILHENLFWVEIRLFSHAVHPAMKFLTQWQVMYSPVILLVLVGSVVFFYNRYKTISTAKNLMLGGILLWVFALFLEAIRTFLRLKSPFFYELEIVLEESCEMLGTIAILSSVVLYSLTIESMTGDEQFQHISNSHNFLTKSTLKWSGVVLGSLTLLVVVAIILASTLESENADSPSLHKKAINESRNY